MSALTCNLVKDSGDLVVVFPSPACLHDSSSSLFQWKGDGLNDDGDARSGDKPWIVVEIDSIPVNCSVESQIQV